LSAFFFFYPAAAVNKPPLYIIAYYLRKCKLTAAFFMIQPVHIKAGRRKEEGERILRQELLKYISYIKNRRTDPRPVLRFDDYFA
jgi:hypothetical protein